MEFLAPNQKAARRVLILGARASDLEELTLRFAAADLCVDLVHAYEDALTCFYEQGGHNAVFLIGAETQEQRRTVLALHEISPDLVLGQSANLPDTQAIQELAAEIEG
ncbi:MAG: hypothetical protein CSA62_03385 [Planctomycetota bacterium]|nr:MAG: hypothetical protein CSA62_03385 [Planctomycetota bacterium]